MTESASPSDALQARIHSITLGVADLERSLAFYRDGLGLPTRGLTGTEYLGDHDAPAGATVMFHLDDGLVLSLYPRTEMAKDAGVDAGAVSGCGAVIGHFVSRREDVDRVLELAARAGARVPCPAHDRPWGIYSGYFADPDGHLWEILCVTRDGPPS